MLITELKSSPINRETYSKLHHERGIVKKVLDSDFKMDLMADLFKLFGLLDRNPNRSTPTTTP